MASSLVITKELNDNGLWLVRASINAGGTLPREIFIYENSGTTILTNYIGVCSVEELTRLQVFTGTALPQFGNKYVRTAEARVLFNDPSLYEGIVANLVNNVKILSTNLALASIPTVQTISIP